MRLPQRTLRALVLPAITLLQASTLISCGATDSVDPLSDASAERHHVRSITVTASDSSLTSGQQVQATAVVRDPSGREINTLVTWSVEKSSIASVSSSGLITAGETAGTTIVSATADGVTSGVAIDVAPAATTSDTTGGTLGSTTSAAVHMISITANSTTIKIGESTQISGVVRDINGTPISGVPITWTTSPTTVATIASTGATTALLTGKGVGSATVYAKADTAVRYITVNVVDSASSSGTTTSVTSGATGGSYGSATAAELPRTTVNTAYPNPLRQVRVPAGANLQSAIDAAQPGDELLLAPGATYSGNFYLPDKGSSTNWITIRTDVSDATIGYAGTRMTPSRAATANLAKIVTPNIYSTITTAISAHHYRFTGVEIGAVNTGNEINAIVRLGDNTTAQNSPTNTANNLIFDRTYIHGTSTLWVRRCVMVNSASTAVVDSWVSECHSNSGDSQAIVGWNGPGPYLIQNNYLEAGHEVIMFGGGGVTQQNVSPSDITIRGNHITRPNSWKNVWQVKNLVELKHARRTLIEGNVIENTWADAQNGFAFVMKSENQNWDTPWTQTTDITIRYNRIRNTGSVFNIAANPSGAPAVPAARFVITDNIIENVGTGIYGGDGRTFQLLPGLSDIVLMHNTAVSASGANPATIYLGGGGISRLVVHSNVLHHGYAGVKGDNTGEGSVSLNTYAPGALYSNNAMAYGGQASNYPTNNWFPATLADIGFTNLSGGDYRLSASSSYLNKGYDGRDIGADVSKVTSATSGAIVPP